MNSTELKRQADRYGVVEVITGLAQPISLEIPLTATFVNQPLEDLNLSVRSYNALKRSSVNNMKQLAEFIMSENGLSKIRNLGKVSITEIKQTVLRESYAMLSEDRKETFWNTVIERNRL